METSVSGEVTVEVTGIEWGSDQVPRPPEDKETMSWITRTHLENGNLGSWPAPFKTMIEDIFQHPEVSRIALYQNSVIAEITVTEVGVSKNQLKIIEWAVTKCVNEFARLTPAS